MKINTTELVISAVRRSQYPEDKKIEFLHTAFLVFVWTNGEYDVKINKKEA